MKKFFSLMVIAALSITMVGCKAEEKKKDDKAPAPAAGDAKPAEGDKK